MGLTKRKSHSGRISALRFLNERIKHTKFRTEIYRKERGLDKHGLNSFKYYAAKQWNMLPDEVRDKAGTKEFIRLVRNLDF